MIDSTDKLPSTTLPTPLVERLSALRAHLQRKEIVQCLLALLIAFLLGALVVYAGDRVLNLPVVLRLVLFSTVIVWVGRRLWALLCSLASLRRNGTLSAYVTARDPVTGDRLQTVLNLAESGDSDGGSQELRAAAVERLAHQVGQQDLGKLVNYERVRRLGRWAICLAIFSLVLGSIAPAAYWNAWGRFLTPLSAIERYTFAKVASLPDVKVIPLGEPWTFDLQLAEASRWKPTKARVKIGTGPTVAATLREDGYHFSFPALHADEELRLRLGDFTQTIRLLPKPPPGVVRVDGTIRYPSYLERPDEVLDLSRGQFRPLAGSTMRIALEATEKLSAIETEGGPPARVVGDRARVEFDPWYAGDTPARISLSMTDVHGLFQEAAYILQIDPKEDEAPSVFFEQSLSHLKLLEGESLVVGIRGTDDYGLKEIGLICALDAEFVGSEVPLDFKQILREGAPQSPELTAQTAFTPHAEGLRTGLYQLRAYAIDYKPGRLPTYSEAIRLEIISLADHAAMVRAAFTQLQEDLEDAARKEEALYQENQRLTTLEETADLGSALEKQAIAETANAERLQTLAERGQGLLEEALKNEEMQGSAMATWSQMIAAMQSVGEKGMPAVAEALNQAASTMGNGSASAPGSAGDSLASAVEKQKKVMEELAEAMKDSAATGQMLEAGTFVNRLHSAANRQREIANNLLSTFGESLGIAPSDLSPSLRKRLDTMAEQHGGNASEIREIEKDLGHFHNRSGDPRYETMRELMEKSGIHGVLPRLTETMGRNQLALTIPPVREWADKLDEWAKLLSQEAEPGDGASGGQSPKGDISLMMKLMRLVQDEMGIRDQTRVLESERDKDPNYVTKAQRLGDEQTRLAASVVEIMGTYSQPALQQVLGQVAKAMDDSRKRLMLPDTGGETIAAQTEVIELLGQAAQNQSGAANEEDAVSAMKEAMMKMAIGNNAGGNQHGEGFGGRPEALAQGGDGVGGPGGEEREIDRVQGATSDEMPEEFREDLTQYFERLEDLLSEEREAKSSVKP